MGQQVIQERDIEAQKKRIEALASELLGAGPLGNAAEVRVVGDDMEIAVADARQGWTRCMVYVRGAAALDAAESALLTMLRRRLKTGGG